MIASVSGLPGTVERARSINAFVQAWLDGTSNNTEFAPPLPPEAERSQTPLATGVTCGTGGDGGCGTGADRRSGGAARSSMGSSTAYLSTYILLATTLRKSIVVLYP